MSLPPSELTEALSGRYRFHGEIGSGGMATVYVAEDLKHHREVAVKVLRPDLAAMVGHDRFLREIEIAARLQHPHILMLLDSGEAGGLLFYVMPFVDGLSLRDRLTREGELPIGECMRILRDVADALAHAHAHGVVHRDIKPDNVLLTSRHALVTDFGVARAVTEATAQERLTNTGVALGTPAYMAPEQAVAERNVDHRADIYAFGALAYELLTGQPPFVRPTARAVLSAHLVNTPEPLEHHRRAVPAALSRVVMRCLEKNPADRWQSAEELLAAVEGLNTPGSGTTLVATRGVKWSSLRRIAVATGVIATLTVVAVLIARMLQEPESGAAQSPNRFAVAPFDRRGAGAEDIGGTIAELVHHRLDGAGPLTGVSLAAIGRLWSGPADRAAALRLGRDVSAGLVIYGRAVSAAGESVWLTATLLDAIANRPLGDYEATVAADQWLDAADDLAVWTLETVSSVRQLAAVPLRSIGSSNPAAVKAFITGEGYYRRSDNDSARVFYEQALALDSGFALAHSRLGNSNWTVNRDPIPDFLRAGRLNHGLAKRETLVLEWDSLYASYLSDFSGDRSSWDRFMRLAAVSERLVQDYPLDAEAWHVLGEWRFHVGPYLGVTDREARQAFNESLRLDPGFIAARRHLHHLTLHLDGPDSARALLRRTRSSTSGVNAERDSLLLLMLDQSRAASESVQSILPTFSTDALLGVRYDLKQWADSAEATVTLARIASTRRHTFAYAQALAYRGRLAESLAELQPVGSPQAAVLFPAIARLGGIRVDSADRALRSWIDEAEAGSFDQVRLYQALRWWAMRGDSASLRRVADLISDRVPKLPPADTAFAQYATTAARAYIDLVAGDKLAALRRLEQLPTWPSQTTYHEWLVRVDLLASVGRPDEAAELLAHPPLPRDSEINPEWVLAELMRGRVNENLGNRNAAISAYSHVQRLWRNADAILQATYVAEAREALRRLNADFRE